MQVADNHLQTICPKKQKCDLTAVYISRGSDLNLCTSISAAKFLESLLYSNTEQDPICFMITDSTGNLAKYCFELVSERFEFNESMQILAQQFIQGVEELIPNTTQVISILQTKEIHQPMHNILTLNAALIIPYILLPYYQQYTNASKTVLNTIMYIAYIAPLFLATIPVNANEYNKIAQVIATRRNTTNNPTTNNKQQTNESYYTDTAIHRNRGIQNTTIHNVLRTSNRN
jgi:hypothetical protein